MDLQGAHDFLVELTTLTAHHQTVEADHFQGTDDTKRWAAERTSRWLQAWGSRRRKLTFSHVAPPHQADQDHPDPPPAPACSYAASKLLVQHWQPIFDSKNIDEEAAQQYLRSYPIKASFDNVQVQLTFDEFHSLLLATPRSSPGPDGFSVTFWQKAPLDMIRVLLGLYVAILAGSEAPEGFNKALVIFILKANENPAQHVIAKSPC